MSNLYLVLFSIILGSIFLIGGGTYLGFDSISRQQVNSVLRSSFSTYMNAYNSYKIANKGYNPIDISELNDYINQNPDGKNYYNVNDVLSWSIQDEYLCLTKDEINKKVDSVNIAMSDIVNNRLSTQGAIIKIGNTCQSAKSQNDVTEEIAINYFNNMPKVSILFRSY